MAPPQAYPTGKDTGEGPLSAALLHVETLTKRADFQRASRGPRVAMPGFILQMRRRRPGEAAGTRIGFTCSKKVGNAVARNRAKRRLREIARLDLLDHGQNDADYVLIGRHSATATLPFNQLQADFRTALDQLHRRSK